MTARRPIFKTSGLSDAVVTTFLPFFPTDTSVCCFLPKSFATSAPAKDIAHETQTAARSAMFTAKKYSQRIWATVARNMKRDQISTKSAAGVSRRMTFQTRTAKPPSAKMMDHPNEDTA